VSGEWRLGAIKPFLGCHKVVPRGEMTGSLKACFNRLRTPKRPFAYAQTVVRVGSNPAAEKARGR